MVPAAHEDRQRAYLRGLTVETLAAPRPRLSLKIIRALNADIILRSHPRDAGKIRTREMIVGLQAPCGKVQVTRRAPSWSVVPSLIRRLVEELDRDWETEDPIMLAALTLAQLNFIHPFIEGNGRTARSASYMVLCLKAGRWLPGDPIIPDLIQQHRAEYVEAVQAAHRRAGDRAALGPLHALLSRLLSAQLGTLSLAA